MECIRHSRQSLHLYDSSVIPQKPIFYERRLSRITIFKASRTAVLMQRCQAIGLLTDVKRSVEEANLQLPMEIRSRTVDAFPGQPSNRSNTNNCPSHIPNGTHTIL